MVVARAKVSPQLQLEFSLANPPANLRSGRDGNQVRVVEVGLSSGSCGDDLGDKEFPIGRWRRGGYMCMYGISPSNTTRPSGPHNYEEAMCYI